MLDLQGMMEKEQPEINTVLARYVNEMPMLSRPVAEHILFSGGKRLRPMLTLLCGRIFGYNSQDLYSLGAAVEMLHAATLLHDDILDSANTRRGKESAHIIFGTTKVVLAGDALLAKALHMVSTFKDSRLTTCISNAVLQTAEGEVAEFTNLRNLNLSQQGYLDIITGKTAWMLRAAAELGAIRSGANQAEVQAVSNFAMELGIAFQVVDDALDFAAQAHTGKPSGGDMREGKVTPPLMLYLESLSSTEAEALRHSFSNQTLKEADILDLCKKIQQGGFDAKTREMANQHISLAKAELSKLPNNTEQETLFQMLAYIQTRTK